MKIERFDISYLNPSILVIRRKINFGFYLGIFISLIILALFIYFASKDIPIWLILMLSLFSVWFYWKVYKMSSESFPRKFTFNKQTKEVIWKKGRIFFSAINSIEIVEYPEFVWTEYGGYPDNLNLRYKLLLRYGLNNTLSIDLNRDIREVKKMAELISGFIGKSIRS